MAVTFFAALMVTEQIFTEIELQSPDQLTPKPGPGVAVKVTIEFKPKLALQVVPQLIPAGSDMIVPLPVLFTVKFLVSVI